ncbi:Hexose carrier protein HEX6 [Vitis vinifera]|uniref:Hexose carrier protein HEX6 n=1 Tax=Vitis vinifera TaxID=29760 RepID=A0A438C8S5_VITVI|nr:Hexose carrier protein HEX6 [Vitis vinifera]
MAVGIAVTSHGGHYNGRITLFVVLSCMMAGMGGVIFDMILEFQKFFPEVYKRMKEDTKISNYCKFDSQLLTSFTSSLYIAGLVASFVASWITKKFGRKPTILAGGAAFLIGSALGGAAFNVYMVILGRILLGVGVGGWGWRVSLALAAVPASILTLGALFLPETPNSLIQRSKDYGKAELMLQRVRGTNDVQAELDDLVKASSLAKTINDPFKKILQRKYRPQLVMAIAIPFFQQVTGINVIAFYAPVLFRAIGLGVSASLLSAVVTGVVGGILAAELGDHGGCEQSVRFSGLLLICVYVAGFGWSWGPLGWLVPSEIFPLEIRSAGQSITVAVSFIFTFIVAQTFLSMLCHFKSGIFFFFGGWVVLMTAFVYYLLPETKSIPIEQMDRVWKEHWFWKRIVVEEPSNPKMETA